MEPVFSKNDPIEDSRKNIKMPPGKIYTHKKKLKRLSGEITGPSIKDALAGKVNDDKLSLKQQHEIYTNSNECEDFTSGELMLKWDYFLKRLDDRPNLQSTLSKRPQLKDEYQIVLDIDNSVQEDLINSIKPELVSWLRSELKNSKIRLVTNMEQTEKDKIIYTDSEKYNEMLKKNPNLELLKQKFNLDFE